MIILKVLFWLIATPCILIAIGSVWLWVLVQLAKLIRHGLINTV